MCNVLCIIVCPFVLFLLAIVLSAIARFTASYYPFGVFKHFSSLLYIALCQRNPDIKERQILE